MDKLLSLDSMVFEKQFQIDKVTTQCRLEINNETDIGVFDGEFLMGYISLYPIPKSIYNRIKTGLFNESEVELNTLPYKRIGFYYAYLSGIVINKINYPRLKATFLFEKLERHLYRLRLRGVFIKYIVAHAVSVAGRKTLIRMNFKETASNIFVYNCYTQGIYFLKKRIVHNSTRIKGLTKKMVYLVSCFIYDGTSVWDRDT